MHDSFVTSVAGHVCCSAGTPGAGSRWGSQRYGQVNAFCRGVPVRPFAQRPSGRTFEGTVQHTALECAAHFRACKGKDAAGIIAIEHRADRIVEQIHELLDNSFIMRFDIPDSMKLTDNLDDVVDGMRKVALHLEAYAPFVSELSPDAMEVFGLGEAMLKDIDILVDMLSGPRLSLAKVREVTNRIDAAESKPTNSSPRRNASWWPSMPLPALTPSASSPRTSCFICSSR